MGDMRRAALVIECSDSDLSARIASDRSEGGGSNLLRVVIDQMAERHGRVQGMGRQPRRKRLLLRHGHHDNDVGSR